MPRALSLLLCVCLMLSILTGCQTEQTGQKQQTEETNNVSLFNTEQSTKSAEEAPTETIPVATGTLKTELLTALSWDSGRTEATGDSLVAETEDGIYLYYATRLFYADKSDLSYWVAVCPDPDCVHSETSTKNYSDCSAMLYSGFVMRNNRIYYAYTTIINPEIWSEISGYDTPFVASIALDGTDRRAEHIFGTPEGTKRDSSGHGGAMLIQANQCLNLEIYMNQNGVYDAWLNAADENGEFIVYQGELDHCDAWLYSWKNLEYVFGDQAFYCVLMDPDMTKAYMLKDRTLTCWDFSGLPYTGSNLSGDNLWCFRPGDGYYAIDLNTRAETRLADCQLEVSNAHIVLRNCILESTMVGWNSPKIREDVTEHSLRFYDGVQWHDVTLPEEVKNIADTDYLEIMAVTSDRILFIYNKGTGLQTDVYIYQILLGTDAPALEYLGWYEDISGE